MVMLALKGPVVAPSVSCCHGKGWIAGALTELERLNNKSVALLPLSLAEEIGVFSFFLFLSAS